jgi:hypothetical protein
MIRRCPLQQKHPVASHTSESAYTSAHIPMTDGRDGLFAFSAMTESNERFWEVLTSIVV